MTHLTSPKYTTSTPTLKPRLARALLKHLLSTTLQPLGVYYGAILGLTGVMGAEGVRVLLVGNVKEGLNDLLREALEGDAVDGEGAEGDGAGVGEGEKDRAKTKTRRREAEEVVAALLQAFHVVAKADEVGHVGAGEMEVEGGTDALRESLIEKLGDVVGNKVGDAGNVGLARAVLGADVGMSF